MDVNTLVAHLCKQVGRLRRGRKAYDGARGGTHALRRGKGLKPCCAGACTPAHARFLPEHGPCGATGTAAPRLPWETRCRNAAYFVSLLRAPGGGSDDHKMDGLTHPGIRLRTPGGAGLRPGLLRKRAWVRSDCRSPFPRGGAAASAPILVVHRACKSRWNETRWCDRRGRCQPLPVAHPLPRGMPFLECFAC